MRSWIRALVAWFRAEEIAAYHNCNGSVRIKIRREIIGWSWMVQSWDGKVLQSGNTFLNADAFAEAARWAPCMTLQIARGTIKVEAAWIA